MRGSDLFLIVINFPRRKLQPNSWIRHLSVRRLMLTSSFLLLENSGQEAETPSKTIVELGGSGAQKRGLSFVELARWAANQPPFCLARPSPWRFLVQTAPYFGRSGIHLPSRCWYNACWRACLRDGAASPVSAAPLLRFSCEFQVVHTQDKRRLREAAGVHDCGNGANNFVRTLGNERRDESKSCVCGSTADTFPDWIWYVLCLSFPVVVPFHFKSSQSDSKTHARKNK